MSQVFLLVDDDVRVRSRLRELLEGAFPGANIGEVACAEAALSLLPYPQLTAVLLDLRLGGRSGLSALPELRAGLPGVPIVLVTSAPAELYRSACLDAGASALVSKSRAHEDLLPVLAQLLGRPTWTSADAARRTPP